tara:strand:- start:4689 stop:4793 length:105 start_codon:yes stop_codon:yes gene_type:complete
MDSQFIDIWVLTLMFGLLYMVLGIITAAWMFGYA